MMGIWWLPGTDHHHHHSQGNHHENPESCMTDLQGKNPFSVCYSKPSPFAIAAFLKNSTNSETVMCEVKTIWLMINKNINICVGVYWNDGGVSGLRLSGWSNSDLQCDASGLPQSFFCDAQMTLVCCTIHLIWPAVRKQTCHSVLGSEIYKSFSHYWLPCAVTFHHSYFCPLHSYFCLVLPLCRLQHLQIISFFVVLPCFYLLIFH